MTRAPRPLAMVMPSGWLRVMTCTDCGSAACMAFSTTGPDEPVAALCIDCCVRRGWLKQAA